MTFKQNVTLMKKLENKMWMLDGVLHDVVRYTTMKEVHDAVGSGVAKSVKFANGKHAVIFDSGKVYMEL